MTARCAAFSAAAVVLTMAATPLASPPAGLGALAPDVALTNDERQRLAQGQAIVRVTAARDGHVALTGIVRVDVTPERLLRWTSNVEALQKGKYVPEIGRFSAAPRVEDLRGLTIDRDHLEDLEDCRPGDCGVKLSASEIAIIAGRRSADLIARFRGIIVARATQYQQHGPRCMLPFHDHRDAVNPAAVFNELLQRLPFFRQSVPAYADYLQGEPNAAGAQESFLYWAKENLGMKPVISITHFSARRFADPALPEVVVVAKQVYASHYRNGSISVTALVVESGTRYLVYLNRSHIDAFQGLFGGVIRSTVERRVRREAPGVLQNLRKRLESGDPPA